MTNSGQTPRGGAVSTGVATHLHTNNFIIPVACSVGQTSNSYNRDTKISKNLVRADIHCDIPTAKLLQGYQNVFESLSFLPGTLHLEKD